MEQAIPEKLQKLLDAEEKLNPQTKGIPDSIRNNIISNWKKGKIDENGLRIPDIKPVIKKAKGKKSVLNRRT